MEMHEGKGSLFARQQKAFGDIRIVERICPLCGSGNETVPASRYSVDAWQVKTCPVCSFTYITTAPDYELLFEQMSWDVTSKLESDWRNATRKYQQMVSNNTRWRLRIFARRQASTLVERYARPGRVVDVGCGTGGQINSLSEEYVPFGIEISSAGAEKAHRRFSERRGAAINKPAVEGLQTFPDGYFSAAVLHAYLEHELHPLAALKQVNRVLESQGVAFVKVPNFASLNRRVMGRRWCGFRHPDHLNYFTPKTLSAMAEKAGMSTWFGVSWRMPTSDNMWALLRKKLSMAWLCLSGGAGSQIVHEIGIIF
jgi:SAM-dependent methyltransferase